MGTPMAFQAPPSPSPRQTLRVDCLTGLSKDELRTLGIPIETVSYTVGALAEEQLGYRIQRKDFYLPYLKLLGEEKGGGSPADALEIPRDQAAQAVQGLRTLANLPAFPLANTARSALRKITFDLDPGAFGDATIVFAVPRETAETKELIQQLSDALLRRKGGGLDRERGLEGNLCRILAIQQKEA